MSVHGAIPSDPAPGLKVVLRWLESVSKNDIPLMDSALAPEYRQSFHPKSLGWAPFSKTEYIAFMTKMLAMFDDFDVWPHKYES